MRDAPRPPTDQVPSWPEGAGRGGPPAGKATGIPEFATKSALTSLTLASDQSAAAAPHSLEMTRPPPAMGEAAVGVGHINRLLDADGISRWEPPLVEYRNQYFTHFGLAVAAKAMDVPQERIRVVSSSQTKTGVVLGTPSYMSPELIAGKKVDGRSDLFSLGVVLYELLTGERPFQGDSIATIMFQVTSSPPAPVTNFVPGLPPIFQKLVEKALAKDPEQRFQTGEELSRTLRALKDRLDKALAQAGTATRGTPPPAPQVTQPTDAAGGQGTQQFTTPPGSGGG